jgi:hypothetical protein
MAGNENRQHSRRAYLAATGTVAVGALSGCLEFFTGDAAEFEADPSQVPQDVLDQTGYSRDGVSDQEIERQFEAGGETRDVIVTNKLAEHSRSITASEVGIEDAKAAIFTSLTTPQVDVLGQNFNPVEDMSAQEIMQMVQEKYELVAAPSEEEQRMVTINGEETSMTKFRADAQFEGSPVEMFIHITEAIELGSDFVVTVGGYPTLLAGEAENIIQMAESVEEQ